MVTDAEAKVAATFCWRAMERAGSRLKSLTGAAKGGIEPIEAHIYLDVYRKTVDDLLKNAWEQLPRVISGDSERLTLVCDQYCRLLIRSKQRFDFSDCEAFIREHSGGAESPDGYDSGRNNKGSGVHHGPR